MSLRLSLEIQGLSTDEPVTVALDGQGQEWVHHQTSQPRGQLSDPERLGGEADPDDPMDLGGSEHSLSCGCGAPRSAPSTVGSSGSTFSSRSTFTSSAAPPTSGFIIVSLSSLVPSSDAQDLYCLADTLGLEGLKQVLLRFHRPDSEPAITSRRAEKDDATSSNGYSAGQNPCRSAKRTSLEDLERRATRSRWRPRRSLRSYWRVAGPTQTPKLRWGREATPASGLGYSTAELARSFVEQLNALREVDLAYQELAASDPTSLESMPSAEEFSDFQFYLDPSPLGIDARWARNRLNGIGEAGKITVADLEQGWILDHEDLVDAAANPLIHGENRHGVGTYRGHHGTAVLGEIAAKEGNRRGVIGIVSNAGRVVVASHFRSEGTLQQASNSRVADAIVALTTGNNPPLEAGDVLLLEVQRGGLPTTVDPLDFDAVRLAVANGVIVVEAAGNGGFDLDRLAKTVDGRSFDRRHGDFRDSGSIMVGAAHAAVPHNRAPYSNHGTRIDCFGWGDRVMTAGYGGYLSDDAEHSIYSDNFSGTSAAAPMIVGAAVLIQSVYRENAAPEMLGDDLEGHHESWRRLSPQQMRSLLSDPRSGTPQGPDVRGRIGVMPDLRAILDETLGIVPKVYLRDHLGDSGQTPRAQWTCTSPDIIVTNQTANVEQFGEGSGTENDPHLGFNLARHDNKQLFVRLRNRGLRPAEDARVTVYSAPISTLATPDRWQRLGHTELHEPSIPQGDTLAVRKVSMEDQLSSGSLDDEGYCLVAVAEHRGSAEGPVPCSAANFNWRKYLAMMRNQGNVVVRNVHRLTCGPLAVFKVNGTPDQPRTFEFEVIQRLPIGVTVRLTAQVGLALKMSRGRLWKVQRSSDDQMTLHLPKQPRFSLGKVTLPSGILFPCHFALAGSGLAPGHSLALRQLYRGQEVGRITWCFPAGG